MKAGQPVKLHGVDVRIMDEEQAWHLNRLRMKQNIHIAWDLPQLDLRDRLKEMVKHVKPYKITCYVLIGFNSTIEMYSGNWELPPLSSLSGIMEMNGRLRGTSVTLPGGRTGCGCSSPPLLKTTHPARDSSVGNI